MKTTIDLPEEVVHQIKLRAVIERRTVKQLVEELLRKGLNLANPASGETARSDRVLIGGDELPLFTCRPSKGGRRKRSAAEIVAMEQEALAEEELNHAGVPR